MCQNLDSEQRAGEDHSQKRQQDCITRAEMCKSVRERLRRGGDLKDSKGKVQLGRN